MNKFIATLATAALAVSALGANVTTAVLGGIEETDSVVTAVTLPTVEADNASALTVTVTPVTADGTTSSYKIAVAAPASFDPSEINAHLAALDAATNALGSAKADKATTLAGYGITDAKIDGGVITLGANTITPLTSFTETDPVWTSEKSDYLTTAAASATYVAKNGDKVLSDNNYTDGEVATVAKAAALVTAAGGLTPADITTLGEVIDAVQALIEALQ